MAKRRSVHQRKMRDRKANRSTYGLEGKAPYRYSTKYYEWRAQFGKGSQTQSD